MKTRTQTEHEQYNATHYPGTRQLCDRCDEPTGKCEEDQIVSDVNGDILCMECYDEEISKMEVML